MHATTHLEEDSDGELDVYKPPHLESHRQILLRQEFRGEALLAGKKNTVGLTSPQFTGHKEYTVAFGRAVTGSRTSVVVVLIRSV